MDRVNILGVKVDPFTTQELLVKMGECVDSDAKLIIGYANVFGINLAYRHTWFKEFYDLAKINVCDGFGLILAAKILGQKIPERITNAEAIWKFAEYFEKMGYSIYLLGSKPGIAELAAQKMVDAYPNLMVSGVYHGYFDKNLQSQENLAVKKEINRVKPHLLIVGFGMPLQEKWLLENFADLDIKIAINAGAALDFISGATPRSPRWMTDHGLEWLGRLLLEPRRMWRRYLLGNPIFLWRVLMQRLGVIKC